MIGPDPALILCKSYIQNPVQLVLNAPMRPHRLGELPDLQVQTAQVITHLHALFVLLHPCPSHHADGIESQPVLLPSHVVRNLSQIIRSGLLSAMPLLLGAEALDRLLEKARTLVMA